MTPAASFSSLIACLVLSVCLLDSPCGASSLWGKKVHFQLRPCVWQLHPDTAVPPLRSLSLCMLLRRVYDTEWTAFVYKAPGSRDVELGLGGTRSQMRLWLFGQEVRLNLELKALQRHSVCLTWSAGSNSVQIYLNESMHGQALFANVTERQHLAPNGTLTLGMSHYVDAGGAVQVEEGKNLLGEIAQFRMWDNELSEEELRRRSCADGNVVGWDLRRWKHDCPPERDSSLHCAWSFFEIQVQASLAQTKPPGNCSESLVTITESWLVSVLPEDLSISSIFVNSPASHKCKEQLPQGSGNPSNIICNKCFSTEVGIVAVPAASVEGVQADVSKCLSWTFFNDPFILTTKPDSIRVLPVASPLPITTAAPHTVSPSELPGPIWNMSTTTKAPPDVIPTKGLADVYLRAKVNLNFTGNATKPEKIIKQWLTEKLKMNDTMLVLNVVIAEDDRRNSQIFHVQTRFNKYLKRFTCDFHVQDSSTTEIEQIKDYVFTALMAQYETNFNVIQTTSMHLRQIFPHSCLEELTKTIYGDYFWPETFPAMNQTMRCEKPISQQAFRLCKLHIENDTTSWAHPYMKNCSPLGLENITVTDENAAEVVDIIQNLVNNTLGNATQLQPSELNLVVDTLSQVVNVTTVTPDLGGNIVRVFSDILISDTDVTPVAVSVLNLTDKMGNTMVFPNESLSLTAPSLALSMIDVDPEKFEGLTFAAVSISSSHEPNVLVNQSFEGKPIPEANATISLPSTLHNFLSPGQKNKTRVQFQFYGTPDLFQDPQTGNTTTNKLILNSYIVSASINGSHVSNLSDGEQVVITLRHRKAKQDDNKVRCVFWDFQGNGGRGGWSSLGCETRTLSPDQTSCLCEHLTHFAVLLDVSGSPISETDSRILSVISNVGCGISAIFLGITLLTYLAFEKLRQDYPSKILINLSFALLGLNLLFLLDSWLSTFGDYGLCIFVAVALHYFLLASFTWMALEAVHMYFALVRVFNTYVPAYILKFCAIGWGVPLVIVSLVLGINIDAYGYRETEVATEAKFCWIKNNNYFYVTVVAFIVLVLLWNTAMFVVVLLQIRKMAANKKATSSGRSALQDLRAVASLTVLLGLTWVTGLFSFGPHKVVMMYPFTIFNTLQGLFVFLFHCLMKENVRKQWRLHLCCGALRAADGSDWSGTAGTRRRKENRINSGSSVNTSSLKDTSESGAGTKNHKGA